MTTDNTLILGGSGKTGRRVAARLAARGLRHRLASRSGDVRFDWDDDRTWKPALTGATALYLTYYPDLALPGAADNVRRLTQLAVARGVTRIVLLAGRGEPQVHAAEQAVRESGADFTILECAFFNQNFDEGMVAPVDGMVVFPAADVAEPFIDCDDIADVVVAALTEDGHEGELYEVTGPRSMTFAEAVAEIANASGRDVHHSAISIDAFISGAEQAGVPAAELELMRYLFTTVLDGRNEQVTDGVQRALGRAPRDITDFARDAATTGVWNAVLAEVQS